MRSLRSLGFLIPAKTILVPCIKQKMEVMENVSVKLRNTVGILSGTGKIFLQARLQMHWFGSSLVDKQRVEVLNLVLIDIYYFHEY